MNLHPEFTLHVRRKPEAETLRCFSRAVAEVASSTPNAPSLSARTNLRNENSLWSEINEETKLPKNTEALSKELLANSFEHIQSLTASWRQDNNNHLTLTLKLRDDRLGNEVLVKSSGSLQKSASVALRALEKEFESQDLLAERFQGLPEELRQFHISQEQVYAERETSLLRGQEKLRDAILNAHAQSQAELVRVQNAHQKRSDELEAQHKQRLEDLAAREETLRNEKAELDDRAHTHARRMHQDNLKEVLKKHREFKHSDETVKKRWPVHAACIISLAAAASLFCYGTVFEDDPSLFTTLPATVVFGSTLIFYLVWMKNWSDSHARAEATSRSFEEDFSRAYWLTELILELKDEEEGRVLPPELLSSFSRGLFSVQRDGAASSEHPLVDLIKRIPNPNKISLGKGSISLETSSPSPKP